MMRAASLLAASAMAAMVVGPAAAQNGQPLALTEDAGGTFSAIRITAS